MMGRISRMLPVSCIRNKIVGQNYCDHIPWLFTSSLSPSIVIKIIYQDSQSRKEDTLSSNIPL